MLLTAVRDEFSFHCQSRKLSPRTIKNYTKQIDYLLRFLQEEKRTIHIEDVTSKDIKEFLVKMSKLGRSANYVNDLLKAYKVFFKVNLLVGRLHIYKVICKLNFRSG